MSDKKFDELLKNKLNQREFEWDEAYWESAQELIAAQEKGKKRRGFWIWILAGFLLIGTGAAWYLGGERREERGETTELSMVDGPQSIAGERTDSIQPPANNQKLLTNTTNYNIQPPPASDKTSINNHTQPPTYNITNHNHLRPSASNKTSINNHIQPPPHNTPNHNYQRPSASNKNLQNSISQQLIALHQLKTLPFSTPQLESKPVYVSLQPSKWPRHLISIQTGTNTARAIGPSAEQSKGLSSLPYLSINYSYSLSPRISLFTGLGYQARGNLNLDSTYRSIDYTFGANTFETNIDPQSLHYLTVPIGLGIDLKGRHQLQLGLEFARLININSIVSKTSYNSFERLSTETSRSWGYMQGYKKLDARALMAYRFYLGHGFHIGMEAQYGLRDITDNAFFRNDRFERNLQLRWVLRYDLGRW